MDGNKIKSFLSGKNDAIATLRFLSSEFIPEIVAKLNEVGTRRRMALYGGDRVPENERNLTDVRNRMSLLIEYKLAWIANDVLTAHGVTSLFWTNVVANRFPDLELRDDAGRRGLRIEVKCLQAVAEEKSANFDTLKKDLHPATDYVVVFVWEWFMDEAAVAWDRAPRVLRAFVFHASSMAELRDYNWLSAPPNGLGGGYQGFDLRYAVNCRNGQYNEEEGNYGKLLRIWSSEMTYGPGLTPLLKETVDAYGDFEDFAVWCGFEVLAPRLLRIAGHQNPTELHVAGKVAGYRADTLGILFKRRVPRTRDQETLATSLGLDRVIVLTDKYQWIELKNRDGRWERIEEGRKPKHLARHLSRN